MNNATTHHVSISIEGLLNKSDSLLQDLFGSFGPDIRTELEDRKEKGELLIGAVGCIGFCPINGCPGHEESEADHG
ncbi:hypothetical protein N180_03000 [Pedobacter antarcticus 4BY]|uniref:Uncharacterized protein n=2 Tax=Pedobacter antarcticus TaxID=34086 RepID=A0A081PKK8_9SPHI|nr:hypothetical protein [Pedobacter antarcticus]KEQ31231.1 hypothetical protein N180_03000 [Pedobacter antarcticus 4BY]SFE55739.1 hypothetical protein SAMN03003324_00885 [Pedobacter antarcticus]